MFGLKRFWQSTIGKKVVMAVTGIIGILFVIGHMTGNLLMFKGQDAMHHYALLLRTSMPLLYAVRGVLLLSGPALRARRTSGPKLLRSASVGFVLFVLALGVIVDAVSRHGVGRALGHIVPDGTSLPALLAVAFMGHWVMWLFLAASVFLPYFAVVIANAGNNMDPGASAFEYRPDLPALGTGPVVGASDTPQEPRA